MEELIARLPGLVEAYAPKVVGALVILIVGRIAASIGRSLVQRVLTRAQTEQSVISFAGSLTYFFILTATVLAALAKFGVETASFVAVLATAGFAIGMALQGSLANFAAGVLILVLRPYKAGQYIETAGVAGVVQEVHLFTTVLNTPDNVQIMVPNGQIYGNVIKNYAANPTRRVDLLIGIGYGSSIEKAHQVVAELIAAEERILDEPEPMIAVAELADSSVNLHVRPWVKTEDYWAVRFELTRQIKEAFDANGIEIPFPQHMVHMTASDAS
jgi:small conductance mechanosensitive channel